jgi:hypothetical protein
VRKVIQVASGIGMVCLLSSCTFLFSPPSEDGAELTSCHTLDPLRDDFSSDSLQPKWLMSVSNDGEVNYSVGPEGLVLNLPGPTVDGTFARLTSRFEHDLRNNALTVRVDELADIPTNVALISEQELQPPAAVIKHSNGSLNFSLSDTPSGSLDYDPARDRVWQIREEAGTIYFETGPSEEELAVRAQTSALGRFDPSHVRVLISVDGSASVAGRTIIGGVNQSAPALNYCSASSFVDSFEASGLDSR